MTTVMLAAGDASGDAYAADFVRALKERFPQLRCVGVGGDEMVAAGVELVAHQRGLAVGGLQELLPDLLGVMKVWKSALKALREVRPDLLVLIDSGGFNLPFARKGRALGLPILYYVCPQVWAWRRGRVRKLARRADRLALILPFEPAAYTGTGARTDYVGHPLVDRMQARTTVSSRSARQALGLPLEAPLVALLPGSRTHEIRHSLALHLQTARVLEARVEGIHFVLPVAPTLDPWAVKRRVARSGIAKAFPLSVVEGHSLDVLTACDAAILKPGTATLEASLIGRPMVVAARASALTAVLLRKMVRVDSLTMPNLIAGHPVVPEFLQEDAAPERVADAVISLLEGDARERQLAALERVRQALGAGGAGRRVAAIAEEMLVANRCE
ncbi:lipid-A-disaccharide synthase [Myxococcota bacterium]|nr:lipid-A-disaccharide synthase [Myxococcota bacterium]